MEISSQTVSRREAFTPLQGLCLKTILKIIDLTLQSSLESFDEKTAAPSSFLFLYGLIHNLYIDLLLGSLLNPRQTITTLNCRIRFIISLRLLRVDNRWLLPDSLSTLQKLTVRHRLRHTLHHNAKFQIMIVIINWHFTIDRGVLPDHLRFREQILFHSLTACTWRKH